MSRLQQLEALHAKDPKDVFVNFALAMEMAKAQRFDESLAQFDHVLKLDPNYVAAHFHKAKTLLVMGETEAAQAELRTGIDVAGATGDQHARGEMQELLDSL